MRVGKVWSIGMLALAAAIAPRATSAQGITVSPMIGAYVPGGSFRDLQNAAEEKLERETTLGLGVNVGLGRMLRGSIGYASGATISRDGITGTDEVGDGSVLAGAIDVVLRPLPNLIIVQPYLLGGAGYKKESYSFDDQDLDEVDDGEKSFVLHAGVGLDLSLGPLSLVAEVTDFIGRDNNDKWKVHDAFGMVGVKLSLF